MVPYKFIPLLVKLDYIKVEIILKLYIIYMIGDSKKKIFQISLKNHYQINFR